MNLRVAPRASLADASATRALFVLMLLHAVGFTLLAAWRLRLMQYDDIDLALFTQASAQLLRGSLLTSLRGLPWPGDHSSLVLLLLAPFYAIARTPVTLLAAQSAALAFSAWPIYRLARRESGDARVALAVAALWLANPCLHFVGVFEFHPEAMSVPFLLAALLAVREDRPRAAAAWAALALLGKEDVALVVLALAATAALGGRARARATALALAALAFASLALTFMVLKPAFGSAAASYGSLYGRWGDSPIAIAIALATHPLAALATLFNTPGDAADSASKALLWLQLLGPFAAVPLLAPGVAWIALPVLAEHLLSFRGQQHVPYYQYMALVLPWLGGAFAVALGALRRRSTAAAWGALALAAVLTAFGGATFGPFGGGALQTTRPAYRVLPGAYDRAAAPRLAAMLAALPEGGVVSGFGTLPWVAGRAHAHALHHVVGGRWTFSSEPFPIPTDVTSLVADLSQPRLLLYADAGTGARMRALVARNHLVLTAVAGDLVRYERGGRAIASPVAVSPDSGAASGPVFDGQLRLLACAPGADTVAAGGLLPLVTSWQRVAPCDRTFVLEWRITDAAGRLVHAHVRALGGLLLPPADWPDGMRAGENCALLVPDLPAGDYTLALRVGVRRDGRTSPAACDDPAVSAAGAVDAGRFRVLPRAPK